MQHLCKGLPPKTKASARAKALFFFSPLTLQELVRLDAYYRIKPHTPPLVKAPVSSFEFQPCDRTLQAECFRFPFTI